VLTRDQVAAALRARRSGALFLIDIAVPRDIEPAVHSLENVYLYDIDALEGVVDDNLGERRRAAELAQRLIDGEVEVFQRWRKSREVAPLIAALRDEFFATSERELERFRSRLGPLTETQEQAVRELTRAMTRKFLDRPTRYLRDCADSGESERIAAMLLEMFDLKPAPRDDGQKRPKSGPQRLLKGGRDDT
jgi:glutamyl-tRNA reductase